MKNLLLPLVLFFVLISGAQAQDKSGKPSYKTAFGVRYNPFGFSVKSNLTGKQRSVELVGYLEDGFIASLMYYWNFVLNEPRNLRFYAGGSVQGGARDKDAGGGAVGGVGGVIGLDYKFLKAPLNISLDWQPSYQFGKKSDFQGTWGGIAVRLCL